MIKLFKFFKNTLHEITIFVDSNNIYAINPNHEDVICKNFSGKKKVGPMVGSIVCARYCKHCVGCTIRYTHESVEADNIIIQRFVKCKCGHNNIFNVWRRIKYVLSGKHSIIKEINNDGSVRQIGL